MKLINKKNLGKCTIPTYDLTVEDNSNYMITNNDIIVHNSGKTYTSEDIFGIDRDIKSSFARSGLKVVNSDRAFESLLKKNGINPKNLAKIEKENPELWDTIMGKIRSKAKAITNTQKSFFQKGRLGMIVDGTGHNFEKIKKHKKEAEALGYDTYMVFVDTSLEVAKERNQERDRTVPEEVLVGYWKDTQANKSSFQSLFSGHFSKIDNTVYGPVPKDIQKEIDGFVNKPIQNPIGKQWVETAKQLKKANIIK